MKKLCLASLGLALLLVASWPYSRRLVASESSRDVSPDKRYAMVVYRLPRLVAMPGGGSDAPGYVQLQDSSGRVLHEAELEMVQLARPIEWSQTQVEIPLVAGPWKLP